MAVINNNINNCVQCFELNIDIILLNYYCIVLCHDVLFSTL